MDGVVVDNHQFHFKAWMTFAKKYDLELNAEIYRDKFNGKTNADLFPMLFGSISKKEIDAYSLEKETLYREMYLPEMKPVRGIIEYFELLKLHKVPVALGTSAPPANVDFVLDHLKLRSYFDEIIDGTMVSKGKPDPQVYTLCAQRLGVDPKDCVVFEDSLAGLDSGKNAGCMIVGVATSHKREELESRTSIIIHDFTEARFVVK